MADSNPRIDAPTSIADLLSDPQRVHDAFALLNALLQMRVVLAAPTVAGGSSRLVATPEGSQLVLALRYPGGVPDALAGGATTGDLITTVNKMLAGERAIQSPIGQ